jgi:NTP pyrophosphatase (non-canonical NTP hydrolase)
MCVERLDEIQSKVRKQNKDCSVANYDAWDIASCIQDETNELLDAIVTRKPVMEVASEMGDVLYLLLRESERNTIMYSLHLKEEISITD